MGSLWLGHQLQLTSLIIHFCMWKWKTGLFLYEKIGIHLFGFTLYIFFGEGYVQVFCPFLYWVFIFLLLRFKSSLYVLDNSQIPDRYVFCKYFLQVCGFSSHSLEFSPFLVVFHISEDHDLMPMGAAAHCLEGLGRSKGLRPASSEAHRT